MMTRIIGRRPAVVAVLGIVGMVAVGCSPSQVPGGGTGPTAVITLRLAIEASPPTGALAVLAEQYSSENPLVVIELERVPNEQFSDVLRTQLQGGNGPDLFHVIGGKGTPTSVLPLAEAGYLEPLTGTIAADLFTDDNRALAELDAQIWAQPVENVPIITNYNATVAEELGIDLDFTSIDDVLAACATARASDRSLLRLAGATGLNNSVTALQFAATRVYGQNPDWNEQRAAGEVTFAGTEGWHDTLQTFLTLRDAGCFQDGVEAGVIEDNFPAIAAGTALGAFGPGGAVPSLRQVQPDATFLSVAFPGDSPADRGIFATMNMLAVSEASSPDAKVAAKEFLAWLAEPAQASALVAISGNLPVLVSPTSEIPEQYALLASHFEADAIRPTPGLSWPGPQVTIVLGTGIQGLFTGQTTIDDVLAAMDSAWDEAQE